MHCYDHNNVVNGSILLVFATSCVLSMVMWGENTCLLLLLNIHQQQVQDIYVTTDKVKVMVRKINHNIFE